MSLKVIHLAAEIENADDFHVARLLLLLKAAAGRSDKPVQGIMKLAKMDFLLRYPNCLVRVLKALGKQQATQSIPEEERNTIEARMIRFRFGPWDKRYRRWIGLLVSKGLAQAYLDGRTVNVKLTEAGKAVAEQLAAKSEFEPLAVRSRLIVSAVGSLSATRLKEFIYEVFPEIVHMRWGKDIEL
jgi:hypothetical protein